MAKIAASHDSAMTDLAVLWTAGQSSRSKNRGCPAIRARRPATASEPRPRPTREVLQYVGWECLRGDRRGSAPGSARTAQGCARCAAAHAHAV